MDILYIVMPAYNEEANIEAVVREWHKILENGEGISPESRLVVADSGSTDCTRDILMRLQKEYDDLEILENTDRYHGPKVIALYDHAIKNGADYIFQTDSDGQTNPDEFAQFWESREKNAVIIGNRKVRGDGKDRKFVENVVCILLRIYFGVKVKDANAPFRLMKSEVVKKYLYKLPSDFNIPNIMMTTYFAYYGEKMSFYEITFKPRQGGKNSINIKSIVKIGWKALGDFSKFKKDMVKNNGRR